MNVKVILPSRVLLDRPATKVVVGGANGSFCLLPRHVDFAASLVPGILAITGDDGEEQFVAVDEGVLVKCGPEVLVSVRDAVTGPPLGELRQAVEEQFRRLDAQERQARAALGRLEASLLLDVTKWEDSGRD